MVKADVEPLGGTRVVVPLLSEAHLEEALLCVAEKPSRGGTVPRPTLRAATALVVLPDGQNAR